MKKNSVSCATMKSDQIKTCCDSDETSQPTPVASNAKTCCNNPKTKNHDHMERTNKRQRLLGTKNHNISRDVEHKNDGATYDNDVSNQLTTNGNDEDSPTPPYGSKEYWEKRYTNHVHAYSQEENQQENSDIGDNDVKTAKENEEELPYHSWYFTYDEMKPIIMPLLLGGREVMDESDVDVEYDDDEEQEDHEESDVDCEEDEIAHQIEENKEISPCIVRTDLDCVAETNENSSAISSEYKDSNEKDESKFHMKHNDGLCSNGPVRILEIGCGDVPLGVDLVKDLLESGESIANIVSRVVCTDYSNVLIDMMKKKNTSNSSSTTKEGTQFDNVANCNVLEFEEADAMNMDKYQNGSFQLILEKGLLDAMLSDEQDGVENCIKAVAECARLLTPSRKTSSNQKTQNLTIENDLSDEVVQKGCLIICSHLNANTPKGLDWLQEIVITGLLHHTSESDDLKDIGWKIEVHANSGNESKSNQISDDDENDGDNQKDVDNEEDEVSSENDLGPAIYVIHKFWKTKTDVESLVVTDSIITEPSISGCDEVPIEPPTDADATSCDRVLSNVPLIFFSYD
jgi:hypothetical protein